MARYLLAILLIFCVTINVVHSHLTIPGVAPVNLDPKSAVGPPGWGKIKNDLEKLQPRVDPPFQKEQRFEEDPPFRALNSFTEDDAKL
uniref:Uncharacterized protein n=1 Tax=Panagrolaimus sp. JU765 TaxID=591449 RepID=A0AC34RMI7_9BILA